MTIRKIDVGAGDTLEIGWESWDIRDGKDARKITLPDRSVSEIRASHVLEHLSFQDVSNALREWNRVLIPGGRLYVAVPDLGKIIYSLVSGIHDPKVFFYLMGGQTNEFDFHLSAFTVSTLVEFLEDAGFERIRQMEPEGRNCSSHPISMNFEAFTKES